MAKTIVPTGTTATFGTSSWAVNIDAVSETGVSRESINTSHFGTSGGFHSFTPAKLVDGGSYKFDGHLDPDVTPPMTGAAETMTITWPLESGESTAASWAASVFFTEFEMSAPNEDKATCSFTVKVNGKTTKTTGS